MPQTVEAEFAQERRNPDSIDGTDDNDERWLNVGHEPSSVQRTY